MSIPVLDLDLQYGPHRDLLLNRLRDALFNVGFLYIKNHDVPQSTISNLIDLLPPLFDLPNERKSLISKQNSPHFLGYSGFAEETTLGKKDLREQFDFATELPVIWADGSEREPASGKSAKHRCDFTRLYWRLRGPNQWPSEEELPGFRKAVTEFARSSSTSPLFTSVGSKSRTNSKIAITTH
jgi:isopenicillin N synthase-like dioxygenase